MITARSLKKTHGVCQLAGNISGNQWSGLAAVSYLFATSTQVPELTLYLPFFKDFALVMGVLFIPWAYLVVVGSSNAVNLTDGLDGLAILPTVMVAVGLGMIAYVTGRVDFAVVPEYCLHRRRR